MKHTILRLTIAVLALIMMLTLASCKDDGGNSLIDTTTTPDTTPAGTTTAHTHAYKETVYPATCTAAGYTVHLCDCGNQYVDSATPMAAHTYGAWETTTAPTCTAEGVQTHKCTVCGATETQKLSAAGHKYVDTVVAPTKTTQGYTVHTCSVCGNNYSDSYTNATGSLGLEYSQNADGTLTIVGMGQCTDTDIIIYSTNSEGKNVSAIAAGAFAGNTTVKSVYLPASIVSIGDGAFAGCTALKSITVEENNSNYKSVNDVLFSKDGTKLVAYPAGNTSSEFVLAATITEVQSSAFAGCTNLTQFKLASSDNSKFAVIDGVLYAQSAGKLTLLVYPAGNTQTSIALPDATVAIDNYAFYGATKLMGVTFNTGLETIGAHAFDGCSMLSVAALPDGLTKLDSYAFANCEGLVGVSFGKELKAIGAHAFEHCTALKAVIIPNTMQKIGEYAFYDCDSLATLVIGSAVDTIGENAFVLCDSLVSTSLGKVFIYYAGANYSDNWCKINVHPSNNVALTISATLLYYSETEKGGCWHYVGNVPTAY